MRNHFAKKLYELARDDERIFLVSGDIGNRLFDNFKVEFPGRFLNSGVAEQNMVGVAAGLATQGFRPVVYTIASFATARCFEQIKLDVCYQESPVVLVGTGAGLSYASLGPTHYSLEDLAILRALPNMQILAPGDIHEISSCLEIAVSSGLPSYLRLGKKGEPTVHSSQQDLVSPHWVEVKPGRDIAVLGCGTGLGIAEKIVEELSRANIESALLSCPFVKPLDMDFIVNRLPSFSLVITVEEHSRVGGFGSAVLEALNDSNLDSRGVIRVCCDDRFPKVIGDQQFTRQNLGIRVEDVVEGALARLTKV